MVRFGYLWLVKTKVVGHLEVSRRRAGESGALHASSGIPSLEIGVTERCWHCCVVLVRRRALWPVWQGEPRGSAVHCRRGHDAGSARSPALSGEQGPDAGGMGDLGMGAAMGSAALVQECTTEKHHDGRSRERLPFSVCTGAYRTLRSSGVWSALRPLPTISPRQLARTDHGVVAAPTARLPRIPSRLSSQLETQNASVHQNHAGDQRDYP